MNLLSLDDPRWKSYRSGYNRADFDTVTLIRELHREGFSESFWEKVWDDLHHQGDVGEASYAIVPYLVEYQSTQSELDEQLFHFTAVVELARTEGANPPVPEEIRSSYELAFRKLSDLGVEKLQRGCASHVVMGVASVIALVAGQRLLARAYLDFGREAAATFLENEYGYTPTSYDI
jgi:hypothetical protein